MNRLITFCSLVLGICCAAGTAVSQWEITKGPEGGTVLALARIGDHVFAGTSGGGVFRSSNNGSMWEARNNGLTSSIIKCFAKISDPSLPEDTLLFAATQGGLFATSDLGETWSWVPVVPEGFSLENIAACPPAAGGEARYLFACSGALVYRSTDLGASWTPGPKEIQGIVMGPLVSCGIGDGSGRTALLVGTSDAGVYRSTDDGQHWTAVNAELTTPGINTLAVAGDLVVAGTRGGGVFISTDCGNTWIARNAGLTNLAVRSFAVIEHDPDTGVMVLFAGTESGMFLSWDLGSSWSHTPTSLTGYSITALETGPVDDRTGRQFLYVGSGTYGFLMSSRYGDGGYQILNRGLVATSIPGMLLDRTPGTSPQPRLIVAAKGPGVMRTSDAGELWLQHGGCCPASIRPMALTLIPPTADNSVNESHLFQGTDGSGVFRSDGEEQWIACSSGLTNKNVMGMTSTSIPGISGERSVFTATYGGLFRSTNLGITWTTMNTGSTTAIINTAVADPPDDAASTRRIFAGTHGSGAYRSTDNGAVWTAINSGLTNKYVKSFAIAGDMLYAGTMGGAFRSTDSGTTWTLMSAGLSDPIVYCLVVVPDFLGSTADAVFAGTRQGIFVTMNDGVSWTPLGDPPFNPLISSLTNDDTYLYAGTMGSGVYRYPLTAVPLPVQISRFAARQQTDGTVVLQWSTASEMNNYGFQVERDSACHHPVFQPVPGGFVPGHGTTIIAQEYAFTDSTVHAGTWTYRLKQIDLDGTIHTVDPIEVIVHQTLTNAGGAGEMYGYKLDQNHPNPFNPTTSVSYQVAVAGTVKLVVYDILGREAAWLVNERKEPGSYTVEFNATGMASGIYLCRMYAGDFVQTRRFVLVR